MPSSDVARAFVDAYNRADWGGLEALLGPQSVYDEVATGRRAEGELEIVDLFKGWRQAMPDAQGTVTNALDCGNTTVLEVTWTGTFTGPWTTPDGEVEPTNRHHTSPGCIVATIEGDRIKDFRQYQDFMTLRQQLGLPAAPGAG